MASNEDLKLFVSEAEENIQKIEDALLELENDPKSEQPIENMFFAFHSLKGLTAMVGLGNLSKFCHHLETFMQKHKDNQGSKGVNADFINFLFDSVDILNAIIKRVKKGDMTDLEESFLDEYKEKTETMDIDGDVVSFKPVPPQVLESFTLDQKNHFYKIELSIQKTCVFKIVRVFIIVRALNNLGQICYSKPEPELLEKGDFNFDVEFFLVSQKEKSAIRNALDEILEIEKMSINEVPSDDFVKKVAKLTLKWQQNRANIATAQVEREEFLTADDLSDDEETDEISKDLAKITSDDAKSLSIKINIDTLENLMNYFGELIVNRNKLNQIMQEHQIWEASRLFTNMDKLFLEIQRIMFKIKLVKVESTFKKYKRLVRDLANNQGKKIRFVLEGMNVEIDRKILEELNTPLIHIIRNAIHHGIETPEERTKKGKDTVATLYLRTYRLEGSIFIEVDDDGRGFDFDAIKKKLIKDEKLSQENVENFTEELLIKYTLMAGFSTLSEADLISGRGMGLAIVDKKIKELSGEMEIETSKDVGTKFILKVPFTRAILKVQLVKVNGSLFGIPIEYIEQITFLKHENIEVIDGSDYYQIGTKLVPLIYFNDLFDEYGSTSNSSNKVIVWCKKDELQSAAFVADELSQQMDMVIKPFLSKYSDFLDILGSTITADGSICLILDVLSIITSKISKRKVLEISEVY
ncbi:MAG: chemotaxis protein CheA [Candidatus Hodarchaeota archaeon]